jgi:hypothetical protein
VDHVSAALRRDGRRTAPAAVMSARFSRMDDSTAERWDRIARESVDAWSLVPARILELLRSLRSIQVGFAVDPQQPGRPRRRRCRTQRPFSINPRLDDTLRSTRSGAMTPEIAAVQSAQNVTHNDHNLGHEDRAERPLCARRTRRRRRTDRPDATALGSDCTRLSCPHAQ